MSDRKPCNCDQALELTEAVQRLLKHEPRIYSCIPDAAEEQDKEYARRVLKKYEDATLELWRCKHCGAPGGH